ncbi:MAG: 50S ribosomal protein L32 [Elusimicrobia bacterium]|nr:50S ribosomal protein L32 [Elusimicrobiota bacterium]
MPNPKRKHTRSRRDSRRASNWRLDPLPLSACTNPECVKKGTLVRPHTVCPECGWYNGKLVIAPRRKKSKRGEGGAQQGTQEEGKK